MKSTLRYECLVCFTDIPLLSFTHRGLAPTLGQSWGRKIQLHQQPTKVFECIDSHEDFFSPPARSGVLDFIKSLPSYSFSSASTSSQSNCRTSSASSRSQWALPDPKGELQILVGTAGPQRQIECQIKCPDLMSERVSEYMSDRTPDKTFSIMPNRMPEHMSDRAPDRLSEFMSGRMPEPMSDRMPTRMMEYMSGRMPAHICQIEFKECQTECQIKCQQDCHNICWIEC